MKKIPHRNNRIAEQILKDLSLLIKQEIHDKKLGFIHLKFELLRNYPLSLLSKESIQQ